MGITIPRPPPMGGEVITQLPFILLMPNKQEYSHLIGKQIILFIMM